MGYIIKKIDEINFTDNWIYGNKVAYLAEARKQGIRILDGFCVCIDNNCQTMNLEQLKEELQQMLDSDKDKDVSYIVRSSAQYEDSSNHVFPGIFKSKMDVSSVDEMVNAIQECYESLSSEKAKVYMEYVGLNEIRQEYFCVFVQKQIRPEYSGVLFTSFPMLGSGRDAIYLVELAKGHCQDMLQGIDQANSYTIRKSGTEFLIERINSIFMDDNEKMAYIMRKLGSEVEKIIRIFNDALDIEWGYVNEEIVIFQIRPIQTRNKPEEKSELMYGMKATAMEKFKRLGLFPKRLLVISAGNSLEDIRTKIEQCTFDEDCVTVRFSCETELGLPRCFANNKDEAFNFIKENYHENWSVIIHESLQVLDSFELYLDKDKCIIEHVPGMWESDVQSKADAWIYYDGVINAYICQEVRRAKYESSAGIEYRNVNPYTKKQSYDIAKKMEKYIACVRENWKYENGINFHFVCDMEGNVYFLNKRRSEEIILKHKVYGKIVEINDESDILSWNGDSAILLKLNLKRGEESLLKQYVPILKKFNATVYVEFGTLSHPAILLREMGIDVHPYYSKHREYKFS